MREIYRIMDANLNRAREGLRVLEEVARFILEDAALSSELKDLRHSLAAVAEKIPGGLFELVRARDVGSDVGAGSWTEDEQARSDLLAVVAANQKRVQEALRVLEEFGKLLSPEAASFKKIRFNSYALEQKIIAKVEKERGQFF
jgi:thiamine-phosphate pyrophosphorylase